jgi:hypothetical protein
MRHTARCAGIASLALSALGGGLAAAGCNLVVGASDYAVGDAGGAVDVGAAGAEAASGDDAGAPPAEAGPAVCGQGLPTSDDFQSLVKTCLFVVSCDPFFFDANISDCITHDYLESSPSFGCLKSVTTCAEFTSCWGTSIAALADCPNAGASATCDANNRAINCGDQAFGSVKDCRKLGGTCSTFMDPAAGPTAGCLVNPSCQDTDSLEHCLGNNDYICYGGKGFGESCGAINATCTTVNNSSGCYFQNDSCQATGTYSCTITNGNSTLAWCSDGKQAFDFRCARAGLSCATDDAGAGNCVAPGCTLDSANSCTESCDADGKTIHVCIGGAPYAIDCTQYGFSGCAKADDTSQTPPVTYAFCQH